MTKNIKHDCILDWPNGEGETPCSTEYMLTLTQRDLIYDPNPWSLQAQTSPIGSMDDLSPEDYQKWNELDHKLSQLHSEGHIGKSVKY